MTTTRTNLPLIGAAMLATLAAACSSQTDPAESAGTPGSPLAIASFETGFDEAAIEGTLEITSSCVLLNDRGASILIAWPPDRATWDAQNETIALQQSDQTVINLSDGDELTLGGSAASEPIDWAMPPDPSCSYDRVWGIGDAVSKE